MGSANFLPIIQIPVATGTAVAETKAAPNKGLGIGGNSKNGEVHSFQSIFEKTVQSKNTVKTTKIDQEISFDELPEEVKALLQKKFGISTNGELRLVKLPKEAFRVDENGEIRVSLKELEKILAAAQVDTELKALQTELPDEEKDTKELDFSVSGTNGKVEDDVHNSDLKFISINNDVRVAEKTTEDAVDPTAIKAALLESNGKKIEGDGAEGGKPQPEPLAKPGPQTPEQTGLRLQELTGEAEPGLENGETALGGVFERVKEPRRKLDDEAAFEDTEKKVLMIRQNVHKDAETKTDEMIVIKSTVSSKDADGKPVLFVIDPKDLSHDALDALKKAKMSVESVDVEKPEGGEGKGKINPTQLFRDGNGSDEGGEDFQQKKEQKNASAKLPELSQSGLQVARNLSDSAEGVKEQVKSQFAQTLLNNTGESQLAKNGQAQDSASTQNTVFQAQTGGNQSAVNHATQVQAQQTAGSSSYQEVHQAQQEAAAHQIVKGVQSSIGSGRSHVSIQLYPEALGRVHVQIKMVDGVLNASIIAEKESTRAALEQNSAQLRAALNDSGIQVDKISVTHDQQDQRGQQDSSRDQRNLDRWGKQQGDMHRFKQNDNQQGRDGQNGQNRNPWKTYMDYFFT